MHIGKGTILVIGGFKYIKNHLKAFKYLKKVGLLGSHMLVEKCKTGTNRAANFRAKCGFLHTTPATVCTYEHTLEIPMLHNALNMFT